MIYPTKDIVKQIYSNAGFGDEYGFINLSATLDIFIEEKVYEADKARYRKFLNFDDIEGRGLLLFIHISKNE